MGDDGPEIRGDDTEAAAERMRSQRDRSKDSWLNWAPWPVRYPTPKLRFIAALPENPRVLDLGTMRGGSARLVRRLRPNAELHAAESAWRAYLNLMNCLNLLRCPC